MTTTVASVPGRAPDSALAARLEAWRRGLYRFRGSTLSVVGLVICVFLLLVGIFGQYFVPFPEHIVGGIAPRARFLPPSAQHWFGTNELGQDVFSLVVAGTRVSLLCGLAVVLIGATVGTFLGAVAGYFGGWVDEIIMRLTDLKLTIPGLILAMAIAAALGPGIVNMIIAVALSWWPGFARLVRGEVLSKKEELFVLAARALGATHTRLLFRHILPNILGPVIVKMSLDMGFAILTIAALGFIGIGVKPPTPEWGSLLAIARGYMPEYWWTAVYPGLAIFLAVFGFNLLGDGLRDVLDPKARR
jgi:peptide/nickel transport system permease protein